MKFLLSYHVNELVLIMSLTSMDMLTNTAHLQYRPR